MDFYAFIKFRLSIMLSPKLILIMKLSFLLLFTLIFQVQGASFAQKVFLNRPNSSLELIFKDIRNQTGYDFFYNVNVIKKVGKVDMVFNGQLEEVLEKCLAGKSLTFTIKNKAIIIQEVGNTLPSSAFQQQETIVVKGKVTDEKNIPLVGVTVQVKAMPIGTTTDANGNYSLKLKSDKAILVFNYLGFISVEKALAGQTDINVVLKESPFILNEFVTVGYSTQKKINLTGSVATLQAKDLESRPVTSISNALQGQMAGVTVKSPGGQPGANSGSIRIRGIGTLGDSSPLYVVDGAPTRSIDILNPNDIESISVLKDASSASIYGVRGANGVILITTKKGKTGDAPSLTYSTYYGVQTPTALPELVGSVDYMQLLNEAQINVGQTPTYTSYDVETVKNKSNPNYFGDTDWVKEILKKNTPQQSHNLSLSGDAKNINYFVSYGNLNEKGLITGDNYSADRNNARLRINTKLMDRLDVDANFGYTDRKSIGSAQDIGSESGPLHTLHVISPLSPVRFTTGKWAYVNVSNPIAQTTDGGTNTYTSQEVNANLSLNFKVLDGWTIKGQYVLNKYNSRRSVFSKTINYYSPYDNSLIYQANNPNKLSVTSYSGSYHTFIGLSEYQKTFNKDHNFKVLVGASKEKTVTNDFSASRTHLPLQDIESINLGTDNQVNNGGATVNALASMFGRSNYAYKNKYLAELNFRYDGSTRFAKESRWQLFSSGSVGWVFSEEAFFEKLRSHVESAKLRYSYGSLGNDKVGRDFGYMSSLTEMSTMPIGNQITIGYGESGVVNRILTWESAIQQNVGLDLVFLKGKLDFTAEYYKNRTNDILLNVSLPDVLGAGYPPQNAGHVENKGWELQIGWRDRIKSVKYGVRANLSDVKNRVLSLGNAPASLGDQIRIVGQPIDAFYGLTALRIAQLSDFTYDAGNNKYTPNFPYISGDPVAPGDIMYADLDNDGRITLDGDRSVIGSPIPRYTYGFMGDLSWNNFDFSFFLQGVGKVNGYLKGAARHAFVNIGNDPTPQRVHLDRWTPENPDASYPRLTAGQSHNQRLSTFWLEDASYLRVKNIQLGYTIPEKITSKFRANRVRVYASADNLFTATNFYYSYDPETPVSGGGYYPQVKTFVFGLNITFK